MLDYVRAELLKRLKARRESLAYSQKFDAKYAALQERRMVERLLRRRAA